MKRRAAAFFLILVLIFTNTIPAFANNDDASVEHAADKYHDVEVSYTDPSEDLSEDIIRQTHVVYSHDLLLHGTSSTLSGDLCKASVALAMAAYHENDIVPALEAMGYSARFYGTDNMSLEDSDRVGFTVGSKTISQAGKEDCILYCIAIRGTTGLEWFSDFNLGSTDDSGGRHKGFHIAANRVGAKLEEIFDHDGIQNGNGRRILWFTGHSRGAAVANILAARYTQSQEYASKSDIYAYTFACPRVSVDAAEYELDYEPGSTGGSALYDNIRNYNNEGDAITAVPLEAWGYGRYGIDYNEGCTGRPSFTTAYYSNFGTENSSTSDSVAYETLIQTICPKRSDFGKPPVQFILMMVAFTMIKDNDPAKPTFAEVVSQFGQNVFEDGSLLQQAIETSGPYNLYRLLSDQCCEYNEAKSFVDAALYTTEHYTSEEFSQWTREHSEELQMVFELTGQAVEEYADLSLEAELIIEFLKSYAIAAGQILGCLIDIISSGNSDAFHALIDGHKGSTYVLWINRKYYGHRGYYQTGSNDDGIIPDSFHVRTIGYECFRDSDITSFEGGDIVYIGDYAFSDCGSLLTANLGSTGTIFANTFRNCSSLQELYIPDSVKDIEVESTYDGTVQGSGESTTYYYRGPFYGCTGLKEISVGGVEELKPGMLRTGSQVLEKLTVRGTVKTISAHAFDSTYGYSQHYSVTVGPNTFRYSYDRSNGYDCATASAALILEDGVQTIGEYAFKKCRIFTSVSFPESLTAVENDAFSDCSRLTELNLNKVETVGDRAFFGCTGLQSLDLGSALTVGTAAFGGCTNLGIVDLGNVVTIRANAFKNCVSLESIYIPDSVTTFEVDTQAHNADIDSNQNSGGSFYYHYCGPFYGCTGLKEISIGGVEELEPGMLRTGSQVLEKLTVRGTVTTIAAHAFDSAFGYSQSYYSNSPTSSRYYYDRSNGYDSSAASAALILEDGVQTIGEYAFWNCGIFRTAAIPASVTSIGTTAFDGTHPSVILGYQDSAAKAYALSRGMRFAVLDVPAPDLILPSNVVNIEEEAFAEGCFGSIRLSEKLETVGARAFENCQTLSTVIIPTASADIDATAFNGCTSVAIWAPEGGTVETYAQDHQIPFIAIYVDEAAVP